MDEIDLIDNHQEFLLDHFIQNRKVYKGVSNYKCEECDSDIPEARRVALPGIKICKQCAEYYETKRNN